MKRLFIREDSRSIYGGQATPGAKHLLSRGAKRRLPETIARAAPWALFGVLIPGLLMPSTLTAQKREDFLAIQRDVAELREQVKALQKSQDDRLAAIQAMLQQAVEGSAGVSSTVANLQREVNTKLNDQQAKLVAPVATLGTKVDQMSDEFRAVSTTVADLRMKMNALDTKLADISSAIRTLSTPAAPAPAAAAQAPPDPCAGASAESLWENARRDKSGGKLEIAMQEYSQYVTCFATTANAPVAQFEIGMMYFNNGQSYEDAAKAFDGVLERFPENQKTPDALYYKAVSLMKADRRTEAGKLFKEYLLRYAQGTHVANAHQNLRTLGLDSPPRKR